MKRQLLACLLVFLSLASSVSAQAHETKDPISKDGTPVQIDLPRALHMKNTGGMGKRGPGTGFGLCVFTSIEHAAMWQNVPQLQGFQSWMTHKPGGGTPGLVDKWIGQLCREKGYEVPDYLNLQTNDLDVLRAVLRSGRMAGVTYSVSPTKRYGGAHISHMVNCVAAGVGKGPDGKGWWCVLDNNYPGSYEWMSESQFLRTYAGGGTGWSVVLLQPAPPPVPFR